MRKILINLMVLALAIALIGCSKKEKYDDQSSEGDYTESMEDFVEAVSETTDVPVALDSVEVTWDVLEGGPSLSISLNGSIDGQAFSLYSGMEGDIVTPEGVVLVTRYETEGYYWYNINPDCQIESIEITADTPDMEIANNMIGEMNPQVIYTSKGGESVTVYHYEENMVRFPTGIWGMAVSFEENE